MAAKKSTKEPVPPVVEAEENVDDLLGGDSAEDAIAKAKEEAKAKAAEAKAKIQEIKDKAKAEAKELREKAREEAKAAKEAAKGDKKKRETKGVMVRFVQKSTGETIEGMGTLYYVVRSGGKLHYKEASQVTVLTEAGHEDLDVAMDTKTGE